MSRAARLLTLMQALRGRRRPVTAAVLADELGISLRTVYRDIATLAAEGAPIEGEAGLGYVLRPGFFLPPLMFSAEEVDAVVLGLRLVQGRTDPDLADAARDALVKLVAVLPPHLDEAPEEAGLLAAPREAAGSPHLAVIRRAIRAERKLHLTYVDKAGRASERVVWPIVVGFFEAAEMLAAWCESRQDFRHFRLDRIDGAQPTGERLPTRRTLLLAEWRLQQQLD